jgi:nicotinate dehydrogenase subunit B
LVSSRYLEEPFAFNPGARVGGGTRNSEPYYDIPSANVQDHYVKGPLRVSALRGLGAYANIFAIESFMEELAEKAEKDPIDFRIQHSTDERSIAVLQKLKELTQNEKAGEGEGIGFGFSRYKNTASYCAVAAKVKVDLDAQKVTPLKMWAVIDAGETINPDGIKNQTEGGLIQAASWTLKEEVLFEDDQITSKDWSGYPILRYDAVPETEVHIIDRPELPALGAGEAAQGPTGAAIANAVYAACGKRIRELPVERYL